MQPKHQFLSPINHDGMKKISFLTALSLVMLFACQKNGEKQAIQEELPSANKNNEHGHLQQTKTFSSDVVIRWLNLQLDMLRVPLAAGAGTQAANRAMAYCGIN